MYIIETHYPNTVVTVLVQEKDDTDEYDKNEELRTIINHEYSITYCKWCKKHV